MNDRYIGAGSGYPRYIGHLPLTSNRGIHPHTPRYGLSAVVTSICSIYLFFSRIHTSQVTQQHLLSYVTVACLHTYISLVISFLDASIYLTQFWLQAKRRNAGGNARQSGQQEAFQPASLAQEVAEFLSHAQAGYNMQGSKKKKKKATRRHTSSQSMEHNSGL